MNTAEKLKTQIIDNDLCSLCGTCIGVCRRDVFTICQDTLSVDMAKCVDCGACMSCCPGKGFDFSEYEFDKQPLQSNVELNPCLLTFTGYANDTDIRANGASGGMATALMAFLLANNQADAVIGIVQNDRDIQVCIFTKTEELKEAQKSKYAPAPLNIAIRYMLEHDLRYALVGTPCQLQGLELAMRRYTNLRERIVLRVGLMCGYIQRTEAIEKASEMLGIPQDNHWRFLGWRCGAYPGDISFEKPDKSEIRKMSIYQGLDVLVPFFTLRKCFLCPDGLNKLADITLGDIHGQGTDQNVGIVRTQQGLSVLNRARDCGYISYCAEKDIHSPVVQAIKAVANSKGELASEEIKLQKAKGYATPQYSGLKTNNNKSFFRKYVLTQKARKYMWSGSKSGQRWMHNASVKQLIIKGHRIYTYPSSAFGYGLLISLRNLMRKK